MSERGVFPDSGVVWKEIFAAFFPRRRSDAFFPASLGYSPMSVVAWSGTLLSGNSLIGERRAVEGSTPHSGLDTGIFGIVVDRPFAAKENGFQAPFVSSALRRKFSAAVSSAEFYAEANFREFCFLARRGFVFFPYRCYILSACSIIFLLNC